MKKTKHIQLVLITAALASCNRQFVPQQPMIDDQMISNPADTTLTVGPVYDAGPHGDTLNPRCEEAYPQIWNYSFNLFANYSYIGATGNTYYYPGNRYRKDFFRRVDRFIVRGGWGRASRSVSS